MGIPPFTSLTSLIISDNGRPPPNAATPSPCKEIRSAHRKGGNICVRQAGIDRSPACAIVGRGKGVVAGNLISDLFDYLFTYFLSLISIALCSFSFSSKKDKVERILLSFILLPVTSI